MSKFKTHKIIFLFIEIQKNKNLFLIGNKPISIINKIVEFYQITNKNYKNYLIKI